MLVSIHDHCILPSIFFILNLPSHVKTYHQQTNDSKNYFSDKYFKRLKLFFLCTEAKKSWHFCCLWEMDHHIFYSLSNNFVGCHGYMPRHHTTTTLCHYITRHHIHHTVTKPFKTVINLTHLLAQHLMLHDIDHKRI